MKTKRQRVAAIAGLTIALVFPFLMDLVLKKTPGDLLVPRRMITALAEEWFLVVLLLAVVIFWERKSLASIGFRKMTWRDLWWALGGFVLGVMAFIFTMPLLKALGLSSASGGITKLAQVPLALRIGIVLTAGITEEILFRGYPIERLGSLTGRIGLGAVVAYVLFVALHIPFWGIGGAIQIGVWSIVITVLYVKRRNLYACMLMHILNDAYAFLLLPIIFRYIPK